MQGAVKVSGDCSTYVVGVMHVGVMHVAIAIAIIVIEDERVGVSTPLSLSLAVLAKHVMHETIQGLLLEINTCTR
jgi:hypothetical protein